MDRPRGVKIKRRGELDGLIAGQLQHGLHSAFTEGSGSHDNGSAMILKGAGNDFRG